MHLISSELRRPFPAKNILQNKYHPHVILWPEDKCPLSYQYSGIFEKNYCNLSEFGNAYLFIDAINVQALTGFYLVFPSTLGSSVFHINCKISYFYIIQPPNSLVGILLAFILNIEGTCYGSMWLIVLKITNFFELLSHCLIDLILEKLTFGLIPLTKSRVLGFMFELRKFWFLPRLLSLS